MSGGGDVKCAGRSRVSFSGAALDPKSSEWRLTAISEN